MKVMKEVTPDDPKSATYTEALSEETTTPEGFAAVG